MSRPDLNKVKERLLEFSQKKGYLTFNDILNVTETERLPIDDVDRLCDLIIAEGTIIKEDDSVQIPQDSVISFDRSKYDYDRLYKKIIKIDSSLSWYIDRVRNIEPPRLGEEAFLLQHVKEGNQYAKERLILMFLKVALRIAYWHHEKFGFPLDETIQDANVGLVLAIDKYFQKNRTSRFSTYAPWWIRNYIMRSTQGLNTSYNIPIHLKEKIISVIKIKNSHYCNECDSSLFCPQLINEIRHHLNCSYGTAKRCLQLTLDPISLNELNERDESDYGETEEQIINKIYHELVKDEIEKALLNLPLRYHIVICERFGFNGKQPKSLEQTGKMLGITRERARQIEAKTIRMLRANKSFLNKIKLKETKQSIESQYKKRKTKKERKK